MGVPQSPNPPHLYPQALQLKLYQAFIFSIPILFSIILFLLFYLFYLKRRASNISSPPFPRPRRPHPTTTYVSSPCQLDLKVELKDELPTVLFDEEMRKRDSQCCVCLGEFVLKEELLQVPLCKHVFHVDCIRLWLHTNTTCPLCRCSVLPASTAAKLHDDHANPPPPLPSISEPPPQIESLEQEQVQEETSTAIVVTTPIEESSSNGGSNNTGTSLSLSNHIETESTLRNSEPEGSVVIYIETTRDA